MNAAETTLLATVRASRNRTCADDANVHVLCAMAERLDAELAREKAMRASAGCACPTTFGDVFAGASAPSISTSAHAAGCPAMEGGRLRQEMEHWRTVAHKMLRASRNACEVAGAVERAYSEPKEPDHG